MERRVEVATGESVAFSYELAGLGSRFLGVLVDLAIQLVVLVCGIGALAAIAATVRPFGYAQFVALDKTVRATLAALAALFIFLLFFGYFIYFEYRLAGRTPGKRLVGIRVVRDGGFPLDFTSAVIRNVIRMLEFSLGFYAVSAVCTLLSPLNRRLGDMAAGTIVVRENRFERASIATLAQETRERDDPLSRELTPAQRALVTQYVARRGSLNAAARATLAAQIAATVRPKLPASFEHLGDDDLLVHIGRR